MLLNGLAMGMVLLATLSFCFFSRGAGVFKKGEGTQLRFKWQEITVKRIWNTHIHGTQKNLYSTLSLCGRWGYSMKTKTRCHAMIADMAIMAWPLVHDVVSILQSSKTILCNNMLGKACYNIVTQYCRKLYYEFKILSILSRESPMV